MKYIILLLIIMNIKSIIHSYTKLSIYICIVGTIQSAIKKNEMMLRRSNRLRFVLSFSNPLNYLTVHSIR